MAWKHIWSYFIKHTQNQNQCSAIAMCLSHRLQQCTLTYIVSSTYIPESISSITVYYAEETDPIHFKYLVSNLQVNKMHSHFGGLSCKKMKDCTQC